MYYSTYFVRASCLGRGVTRMDGKNRQYGWKTDGRNKSVTSFAKYAVELTAFKG